MASPFSRPSDTALVWLSVAWAIAVGIFYVATLHEGLAWEGDFAHYLHHATNLVDGKHYLDTRYIVSSASQFSGPYAYPPIYPLLLAPVYWFGDADLESFKVIGIVCFALSLLVFAAIFRSRVSMETVLLICILLGISPYYWQHRNDIMSDMPFMLFTLLALLQMLRLFDRQRSDAPPSRDVVVGHAVLIGILMYLAYGTRQVGLVVPLVMVTSELIDKHRPTIVSLVSCSVFAAFAWIQNLLLKGDFIPDALQRNLSDHAAEQGLEHVSGHLDFIQLDPIAIWEQAQGYRWAMAHFFPFNENPVAEVVTTLITSLLMILAMIGLVRAIFVRITVIEIFVLGYFTALMLFGGPSYPRYLLPLFPFLLFHAVIGYQWLTGWVRTPGVANWPGYFIAMVLCTYSIYGIVTHDPVRIEMGVTHPDSREMFNFIRSETQPDDTIVSRKPRLFAYLTGRWAIGNPRRGGERPELMNKFFEAASGDYYVDMDVRGALHPLTASAPPSERFVEVFRNPHFAIYRFDAPAPTQNDGTANSNESIRPNSYACQPESHHGFLTRAHRRGVSVIGQASRAPLAISSAR